MDLLRLRRSLWALRGFRYDGDSPGDSTNGSADSGGGRSGDSPGGSGSGSSGDSNFGPSTVAPGALGSGTFGLESAYAGFTTSPSGTVPGTTPASDPNYGYTPSTAGLNTPFAGINGPGMPTGTRGQQSAMDIAMNAIQVGVPASLAVGFANLATLGGNITGTQMAGALASMLTGLPISTAMAIADKFGFSLDSVTGELSPNPNASGGWTKSDGDNQGGDGATGTTGTTAGTTTAVTKTPEQLEAEKKAAEETALLRKEGSVTTPLDNIFNAFVNNGSTKTSAEYVAAMQALKPGSAFDAFTKLQSGANSSGASSALDAQLAGLQAQGFAGAGAIDDAIRSGQAQNVTFDRKEYDADPTGLMAEYTGKYLPYGEKLMDQVDLYGSDAYKRQQRDMAMSDVQQQGDAQYQAAQREMFRRGAGGSAGQMGALANQRALGVAGAKVQSAMQSDKSLMDTYQKGLTAVNAQGIEVAKLGQTGARDKATWDQGQDDLWLKAQLGNQSNAANWGKIAVDRYGIDQTAAANWGKIGVDKYSADLTDSYNWGSLGLKAQELDMTDAQRWGAMGIDAVKNDQSNALGWGKLAYDTKALGMDNAQKWAALDTQKYGYDVQKYGYDKNASTAAANNTNDNVWGAVGIGLNVLSKLW